MLSTIRPIIVTISNLSDAIGSYLEYEVRMQYNTDSIGSTSTKTLYHGKSFVDAYGDTEIHLEKMLRDYLWKWTAQYVASAQNHRPACIKGSFGNQLNAIEASSTDLFWNTKIDIVYTYNNTEVTQTLQVCGAWCPAYQKMLEHICCALEDEAITNYLQSYATITTNILPHIPPISTSNFWLGLVLNVNQAAEANVSDIGIGVDNTNVISLPLRHGGTYAMAYPLSAVFEALNDSEIDGGDSDSTYYSEIDGGGSNTVFAGEYDGGTSSPSGYDNATLFMGAVISVFWNIGGSLRSIPVAKIDTCPSRYYVSWILPTGGWTSYGMDGNATIASKVKQQSIVNIRDERDILSMEETPTFSLYTGMVDKDTYAHLMTMLTSYILYVYDTEKDEGFYCTPTTTAATSMPSKTGKLQAFRIELIAINSNKQ